MTIRRLFRMLFAIALVTMGVRETVDPDLWWHLRTGELLLQSGIPRVDPFSYTLPGAPWIAHEWLSDVLMWSVYQLGGLAALSILFALIIAATYWVLYHSCTGHPYLAAFVVLLAALASTPTWGARPQMFNLLFAAFFILMLERWQTKQVDVRTLLWALPLATIVWANLHSGYLFGVVLIGAYSAGLILEIWWQGGKRVWQPAGYLLATATLCMFAALLTPHGFRLWLYPFETLTSEAMQRFIVEWHAPDFNVILFQPFALMLGVGVLAWIYSHERPRWHELFLFAGGAFMGLTSARNIPLFAIAATPIMARHLLSASRETALFGLLSGNRPEPPVTRMMSILNWFLVMMALFGGLIWSTQRISNTAPLLEEFLPIAAVDFMEANDLQAHRVYNSYSWGGYLIWRGWPVYVDGRADVYGDFLFTVQETNQGHASWAEPLDEYDVDLILIEPTGVLATILVESEQWVPIYQDAVAIIFIRKELLDA